VAAGDDTTTTLVIDERIRDDGSFQRLRLEIDDGRLVFDEDGGGRAVVAPEVIVKVMRRYGRPLDDAIALTGPKLELTAGTALCQLRHHAPVDTEARDYTVLLVDGEPPLAAMSNGIAAALRFLVERAPASEA